MLYIFSPEEFKNILGDISFLRNKKNATNLLSTLKTQLYDHMSKNFETIKEDENLCELFDEKSSLDEKTAKYVFHYCSLNNMYLFYTYVFLVENN